MVKYIIEIKYRVICILIVFFSFMLTMIVYKYYIIHFFLWINPKIIISSLNYLILTSVTEFFDVFFELCFSFTKYIIYYYIYYHIVSFLALGLYKREYKYLKGFFMISLFLCIFSTSMFLKFFLPITYDFFFNFQCYVFNVYFEPKMDEYFNFVLSLYYQSYACFQFLLLWIFSFKYTKTENSFIKKFKKFIYIILLIAATILTPPDVFSQIGVFLFLTLSIELYVFSRLLYKNLAERFCKR